ncbi:MAG: hypothetical protein Q9165_002027 [Trypethelium subeluteriae]
MGNMQSSQMLVIILSSVTSCLLTAAGVFFVMQLSVKHAKSDAQPRYIRALSGAFETGDFDSLCDFSSLAFNALKMKNGHLKAKLLLAKQKIQVLKLKSNQPSDLGGRHDVFDLLGDLGKAGEREGQGVRQVQTQKPRSFDTEDLLRFDEESENWSQPTLTPTKSHIHTERATTTSSPSGPRCAGGPQSLHRSGQNAEDGRESRRPTPECKFGVGGSLDHNSMHVSERKHASVLNKRGLNIIPSRPAEAAIHQVENRVTLSDQDDHQELSDRFHTRSTPSGHFPGPHRSRFPRAATLRKVEHTRDDSESPQERQIPTEPRCMRTSKWAATPQQSGEDSYAPLHVSAPAPLPRSISAAGSAAPMIQDYHYSPYAYKYPIHYMPPLNTSRDELLRTVLISGLPIGTDLLGVMKKVRGGLVVSCMLLNTISITGTSTVMVTFFEGEAAKKYVKFANQHLDEIFKSEVVMHAKVAVSLVPTPTTCKSYIQMRIRQGGWTRHMVLKGVVDTMSLEMIRSKLEPAERTGKHDGVLSMWREPDTGGARISNMDTQDGTDYVHILFSSVEAGQRAYQKLKADDRTVLGRCRDWCDRDPCEAPVEQLIGGNAGIAEESKMDDGRTVVEYTSDAVEEPLRGDDKATTSRQPLLGLGYDDEDYVPARGTECRTNAKPASKLLPIDQEIGAGLKVENPNENKLDYHPEEDQSNSQVGEAELNAALHALCDKAESSHNNNPIEEVNPDPSEDLMSFDDSDEEAPNDCSINPIRPRNVAQGRHRDCAVIPGHPMRTQHPISVSLDDWYASEEVRKLNGGSVNFETFSTHSKAVATI